MVFLTGPMAGSAEFPQIHEVRVGQKAPEWEVADWFNSHPLRLSDLRGKVLLVRFWTGPDCPYCRASAPALNEFYERYRKQDFDLIGLYHHKSSAPLSKKAIAELIEQYGFQFPVAIDHNWTTLNRWWLQGEPKPWSSVSFLLDKKGVVRHIHTGGQYIKGDEAYADLQTRIAELLGEEGP